MDIHEYQAKAVLREFGLPVPTGSVAFTVEEALAAADRLPGPVFVVKAQIHAGGRGKAGGVKVVRSRRAVGEEAQAVVGRDTGHPSDGSCGPGGQTGAGRARIGDRARVLPIGPARCGPLAGRSRHLRRGGHGNRGGGGADAGQNRELQGGPAAGILPFHGRWIASALGLSGPPAVAAQELVSKLYTAFLSKDMSLLEIDPLVAHRGPASSFASTPRSPSMTTPFYRHPGHRRLCRPWRGGSPVEVEAERVRSRLHCP